MKILIYRFSLILFIAGILCSCKKYLDKKSDNSLVVPTTIEDLQALLDNSDRMNSTPGSGEVSSDDYYLPGPTFNLLFEQEKKQYTWVPYDYYAVNDWGESYNIVYIANLCLERLALVPVTTTNAAKWNNVKGSALFYRAYAFLNLAWTYSKAYDESTAATDLGIVLKTKSDFNIPSVRASVKESYEKIIADATEAISLLPDLPAHVYRPSKAAAYGLLARANLSMRRYDKAFECSDKYLQFKKVLLNYDTSTIPKTTSASASFQNFNLGANPEIAFFSQQLPSPISAPSRARIDQGFVNIYSSSDWRKTVFFRLMSGLQRFRGSYTAVALNYFSGIATDEMYLTRAECFARAGNKEAAMTDLNTLLQKRWKPASWVPSTATDAADALAKILIERRKELLFRGLRWMDLKRLNKEGANIVLTRTLPDNSVVTLQPNANYYALPLPKDIIDLTGIPQNPN